MGDLGRADSILPWPPLNAGLGSRVKVRGDEWGKIVRSKFILKNAKRETTASLLLTILRLFMISINKLGFKRTMQP